MPANLKGNNFSIPRISDGVLVDQLHTLATTDGLNCQKIVLSLNVGGDQLELGPADFKENATVKEMAQLDAQLIETVHLYFRSNSTLTISVPEKQSLFREVSIGNGQEQDRQYFIRLVATAKKILNEVGVATTFSKFLSEDAQRQIQTRDLFLKQQEQTAHTTITKLNEFTLDLTSRYDARRAELEKEFATKSKALDSQAESLRGDFDKKSSELSKREEELRAKESKIERRKTIAELIKQLDSSSQDFRFELTGNTQRMRWPVFGFTIVLLAILGTAAGYFTYRSVLQPATEWPQIVRSGVLSLAFIVAFAYFLRWMNQWFDQHAREEFRLKRLLLEVRRANLLIETALEWQKDTQQEMPAELLAALSRDLFVSDSAKHETVPPVETLGTALLGAAAQVKLKVGDYEFLLDRRTMKAIEKAQEKAGKE